MRWLPKSRRIRVVVVAVVGLLVLGGIVGGATLGDGGARPTLDNGRVGTAGSGGDAGSTAGGFATEAPRVPALGLPGTSEGGPATAAVIAPPESGRPMDLADTVGASGGGSAVGGDAGSQSVPPVDNGRVVKTATLQVEVGKKHFDAAHDRALQAVTGVGGFVQNSSVSGDRATITFRVPSGEFEAVLTRLGGLGKVTDETVTGEDVTEEFVDVDARLRHWRAQEGVFLDLLSKAKSVSDTIQIQQQLSAVQQNIEQLEGRKRFLEDRTELSTVTLEMFVPGAAVVPDRDAGPSLAKAWQDAWDAGVQVVGGTVIVLGALVPLSVLVGVPALVLWSALRRRRSPAPSPAA